MEELLLDQDTQPMKVTPPLRHHPLFLLLLSTTRNTSYFASLPCMQYAITLSLCCVVQYIIVTGSVLSGLGKGITISSMGVLLKACGLNVTSIKIDPYLNVDAGVMSPFEHGET